MDDNCDLNIADCASCICGPAVASVPRFLSSSLDMASDARVLASCSFLRAAITDRKSVVSGKSVSVRVDLGGRRIIKQKKSCHQRLNPMHWLTIQYSHLYVIIIYTN